MLKIFILMFLSIFLCGCNDIIEQKNLFDKCELKEVYYVPEENSYSLIGNTIIADTIPAKHQTVILFKNKLITINNKNLYNYAIDNLNTVVDCIVLYTKNSNNIETFTIQGIRVSNELIKIN